MTVSVNKKRERIESMCSFLMELQTIFILGDVMSVAYVMLNTAPDKMEAVLDEVKEIKGVEEAYMLYGVYDIIAEVKAENIEELWDIVIKIQKLQNIFSTVTLQVAR